MNIGLNLLMDEKPASEEANVIVSQAEALEAGFEAYALIETLDTDVEQCFAALSAVQELGNVIASVEAYGVDASLKALHGAELATICPAILEEEADKETVLAELNPAAENFGTRIVQFVKNLIAKIIEFFKKLFTNNDKLLKKIHELSADKEKADEKAFEETSVLGFSKEAYVASVKSLGEIAKGIKAAKLDGLEGEKADEIAKGALEKLFGGLKDSKGAVKFDAEAGKLVWNKEVKREKKSLKDLGFKSTEVLAVSGDSRYALEAAKGLGKSFEGMGKEIEKLGKDEGKVEEVKAANKIVSALSGASSIYGKLAVDLAMQTIAMLKAGKGKSSKAEEKKDEEK